MPERLEDLSNAIEECYEFMLGYAAQGLPSDAGSTSGSQLRGLLQRAIDAIAVLGKTCRDAATEAGLKDHEAFLAVLERDASDSLAAMKLVASQPALSSQIIDNLNASIHLRALLTDLFLIDEIFKQHRIAASSQS